MTLVADVLTYAARKASVTVPSGWATATKLDAVEIRDDHLPDTVTEILDRVDCPAPIGKQVVLTGTGSESLSLPSDFHRLARDPLAVYETTTLRRAGTSVSTDGLWTHINTIGSAGTYRYFAVEGYEGNYTIKFERDLPATHSVTVSYVSDVWCKSAGGTEQSEFLAETDVIMLPRKLLQFGIVWKIRERKGFDYQVPLAQFETHLSRYMTDGRTIRTISMGDSGRDYMPMRVPVPDYIPST